MINTHTHLLTYPEGEYDDDPKEDEWKERKRPSLSKTLLLQPVQQCDVAVSVGWTAHTGQQMCHVNMLSLYE